MLQNILNVISSIGNFIWKNAKLIFGIIIIVLSCLWFRSCQTYQETIDRKDANLSAYEEQVASQDKQIKVLNMTTNELSRSKDSINNKLEDAYNKLGIKDKNVKELVYVKTHIHDTIPVMFYDTIFKKDIHIDTMVKVNDWTSIGITADFPNSISITPDIVSEKYVVTHLEKEYVNKRSKVFFIRWFQKKRYVSVVDILESNDLIKTDQSRFINTVEE